MAEGSVAVICGPTAAGKSAIGVALARESGGLIVSADSRQVYRGFDIGTAKPAAYDRDVPHAGIDVADPTETYSAAKWAASVPGWMERHQGRTPIVVGGTGFYIRALFDPLFDAPEIDEDARRRLAEHLATLGVPELRKWCDHLDPSASSRGRTQLLRAIEMALLTGRRLSELQASSPGKPILAESPVYLYVDPGDRLHERIESRVDEMIASGWLDEVARLAGTVPADAPAWKASGYRVMREVALGRCDLSSARTRVIIETRQYAKRQRTWFRHQLPPGRVTRIDPMGSDSVERALEWLTGTR